MKKGCLVGCLLSLATGLIILLSAIAGAIAIQQQILTPPPVQHLQLGQSDLRIAVITRPECPPDEGCLPPIRPFSKRYYVSVWGFTRTTSAGREGTITGQRILLLPLGP